MHDGGRQHPTQRSQSPTGGFAQVGQPRVSCSQLWSTFTWVDATEGVDGSPLPPGVTCRIPDPAFSNRRLVATYDVVEADRDDLDAYVAIVEEFGAQSVLDVGCGTGVLACRLALNGIAVTGVDPAEASLEVARSKPCADRVDWVLGEASSLPPLQVDMAVMTGNVAQVFLTDGEWLANLTAIAAALAPGRSARVRDPDPRPSGMGAMDAIGHSPAGDPAGRGDLRDVVRSDVGRWRVRLVPMDQRIRFGRCRDRVRIDAQVQGTFSDRRVTRPGGLRRDGCARSPRPPRQGDGVHRPQTLITCHRSLIERCGKSTVDRCLCLSTGSSIGLRQASPPR